MIPVAGNLMIRQEKKHETTPFSFLACLEVAEKFMVLGWVPIDYYV